MMNPDAVGFTIYQLMELAGLAVAQASHLYIREELKDETNRKIAIVCGPGNNGGDGLVAARHLQQFGYEPIIHYPKPQLDKDLFKAQVQ